MNLIYYLLAIERYSKLLYSSNKMYTLYLKGYSTCRAFCLCEGPWLKTDLVCRRLCGWFSGSE